MAHMKARIDAATKLEKWAGKAEHEAEHHTDPGRRCYCEGQAQAWRAAAKLIGGSES